MADSQQRVVSVGQCAADHYVLSRFIKQHFGAAVVEVEQADQVSAAVRAGACALVLVNRRLDADGSDGMEIIRSLKGNPQTAAIPVMLVSNYDDAQQQAVAAGAEPGFGKSEYGQATTAERLARFLGASRTA